MPNFSWIIKFPFKGTVKCEMVYLSIHSLLVWIERIQNLFEFSPLFGMILLIWRCRRKRLFLSRAVSYRAYLRCAPSPTALNFIPGLLLQHLISFPSFSYYAYLHSALSPTVLFVAFECDWVNVPILFPSHY